MKKYLYVLAMIIWLANGCSEKPYVIIQIADAQLGFTSADRCQREGTEYVNDMTYEAECLSRAVGLVNAISPDAVVFTGDQVNYADNGEQWEKFAELVSHIEPSIKVFHLPGNHDVYLEGTEVDSSPFTDRYGADRFVHSERGVKLVGMNTNLIRYGDNMEADQLDWLETVLEKNDKERVTVLFGHHPFFLEDIEEPDSYFPIDKSKRYVYFDLFRSMDVDAVYAGHRHDSFEGGYYGIPMKTTTSVAFQIGGSRPSVRVISIVGDCINDEIVEIF